MDVINVLLASIGFLNFVLLLITQLRSSAITSIRYFKAAILGITLWCFSMLLFRASDSTESAILWAKVLYVSAAYIPAAYLMHGLSYPNKKIRKNLSLALISFFILFDLLILFSNSIIENVIITNATSEKPIIFGQSYFWLYLPYMILAFGLVYWTYYRRLILSSGIYRYQLRVILVGIMMASGVGMFSNLILPTLGVFSLNWLGQVATTIWLVVVTYGIVRHRFLDLRLLIVRSLSYLLVTGMMISFFVILVTAGSELFFNTAYSSGEVLLFSFGFLALVALYQPLKRGFDNLTASIFFTGSYEPEDFLNDLNTAIATHLNLSAITEKLFWRLEKSMKVSNAEFVILNDGKVYFHNRMHKDDQLLNDSDVITLLKHSQASDEKIRIFDEMGETRFKSIMRRNGITLVVPFILRDELIGGMIIGEKETGSYYSLEDIQIFKIISPELAVVAKNAISYEQISNFNLTLKEEVERATAKLQRANKRLKELDEQKDEFVSMASHELRTPMVSIRNYVWMVLNGKAGEVTSKQREYLRRALDSTTRLSRLVNSMLNLSRIESGRIILSIAQADIRAVIRDVVKEIGPRAEKQSITITVRQKIHSLTSGDEVKLPTVIIDVDKIREVLINVLGNSLKFTPTGGTIGIGLAVGPEVVQVSISDTGVGIVREHLPLLFKKFSMLRESYSTNATLAQGTGLGLYICKSIIELHDGKIWVESDGPGKGSTFFFTVPRYSEERLRSLQKSQHNGTDAGIIHSAVSDY